MTNLFLAFMVKHAFCDLYFQNKKSPADKTKYIGECHSHYFDHFFATLLVCYIFLIPLEQCLFLALVDYIFHWHIDYVKTNVIKLFKLNVSNIIYWLVQTFDQILHYFPYFLLIYLIQNNISFQDIFKKITSLF